jgi:hypothetical protein
LKLPIPFWLGDRLYDGAEIKRPLGGAIADARRAAEDGDPYSSMHLFAAGGTKSLGYETDAEEDPGQVRSALLAAPYADVEWIALRVLELLKADAPVDVALTCRCGHKWAQESPAISDLECEFYEAAEGGPDVPEPEVELSVPVEFKRKGSEGEVILAVSKLKFQVPTIGACIKAYKKVGLSDKARFQYAVWGESILDHDGEAADPKWRGQWGSLVFERADLDDLKACAKELNAYGISPYFKAHCPKCGREWDAEVPTGDFFASGLRG